MAKRRLFPSSNRPPPVPSRRSPGDNQNLLLAALPVADYARIVPTLTVIPLKLKAVLLKPGERIQYVYFPGGGFCSMLAVLEDGGMVEVATIGREGMVGSSGLLNGNPTNSLTMVQGETDTCYRMKAEEFRREMDRGGPFYDLVIGYEQALVGFIIQSTACNAVHSVEQRLARWLLMARDRMGSDEFPLTQEFVAMMLGASRPTVSIVAGTLQKAGLITYHRGRVVIVNKKKLEAASCECYRVTTTLIACLLDRAIA